VKRRVRIRFQKAIGSVKNNSLFVSPEGGGAGENRLYQHQNDEGANRSDSPFHGANLNKISEIVSLLR
jgi:hypothetical protein